MVLNRSALISNIITPDDIIIRDDGFKNLDEIVDFFISKAYPLISGIITLNELKEKAKKQLSSTLTVFENGFFLFHLKLKKLDNFKAFIILTRKPTHYDKNNYDIHLSFMLLSPLSQNMFDTHLKILSNAAGIFKDSTHLLISLKTPLEVYSYIISKSK